MSYNACATITFAVEPDYALLFPNADNRIQQ